MGSHPLNLLLRFALELAALYSLGVWGWHSANGPFRWVLALGIPLIAAAMWGIFAVPNDPSRSGKAPVPTPGAIRFVFEIAFFALAAMGLNRSGYSNYGFALIGLVTFHYAVSYDRVAWLFRH